MRLFVAIEIPFEAKKEIVKIIPKIRHNAVIKWVEMENLHLTLKFLGEVDEERLKPIEKKLLKVAEGKQGFLLSLKDVGGFPNSKNSRVIWIGVDEGRGDVVSLNRLIEKEMEKLGFERDKNFHPHITIGRVKKGRINVYGIKFSYPAFYVKAFSLIKSVLTPSGPLYTKLREFKLGGKS